MPAGLREEPYWLWSLPGECRICQINMEEKKKLPPVVTTLILTALTSVFWIFFSVYRSLTDKPEPVVPAQILLPFNPKLDLETVDIIKTKNFLESIPETVIITDINSQENTITTEEEPITSSESASLETDT